MSLLFKPRLKVKIVYILSAKNGKLALKLKIEYINDGSAFHKIDPLFINPESLTNFYIYEKYRHEKNLHKFRCLLMDPLSLPKDKLKKMLETWEHVYIHKQQIIEFRMYLEENLPYILQHNDIDLSKKTELIVDLSTDVIKDTFKSTFKSPGDIDKSIGNIQKLVTHAIEFLSDVNSLGGIEKLIGHDYETHTHSVKVGWLLSVFINANIDLFNIQRGPKLKDLLIQATVTGMLHDIGKVKIPENIINKKGKLTNLEYLIMQSHTAYSTSILFDTDLPHQCKQAILYHHENEDGSGYPSGLANNQIPLIAKICHIIDVFDALTSKRHYKEAKTPFEALKIMTGNNPSLGILNKLEQKTSKNQKPRVTAFVRDNYDCKLKRLREKEIIEEEAKKLVEAKMKIRDMGMAHCFNGDLLKRFIHTINLSESFELSGLL